MSARILAGQLLVCTLVVAAAIALYHRYVWRPPLQFGTVDVAEVYRLKERQLIELVISPKATDDDRRRASEMAEEFAARLPLALNELPAECDCLVLLRTAVAADQGETVDLTARLKSKIGM